MSGARVLWATICEIDRLRTLPAAVAVVIATVASGALPAWALAESSTRGLGTPPVSQVVVAAVPFVQVGAIVLGILPVAHEHAGRQWSVTCTKRFPDAACGSARSLSRPQRCSPRRRPLLSRGHGGAGLFASAGDVVGAGRPDLERLAGAWAYLVIIGLLAHAVALCVGHLVPSLVTTLAAVLVVSPLLTALTEHARWLSDQAAGLMYRGGDGVLDGGTGVLVAVAWLLTVGLTGAWLTVRRGA